MTAVRVTESSGSLGVLQVSDGYGGFASGSLVAGTNVTVTENGSGSFTIAASTSGGSTIGDAEDGAYTDGLFTDFDPFTPIGTAVDRFNEVLKALAPAPASQLDNINSLETGTEVFLSFGTSNDQSSADPAYINVASSAGLGAAVDVNGAYNVTTSSNNIRLGAFSGATHISGVLNSDVGSNSQGNSIQNFPAFSFGDGDTGVLRLVVNGSTIKEIDLTTEVIGSGTSGLGTGSHLNGDGSGFEFFSQPTTGTFSNGNPFESFKHRTGQFVIASDSQRRGWNYARVQHVKTGSTVSTNYLEWVNDDNSDALAAAGNAISFAGADTVHLSGIEYFRSGTASYVTRVSNAYSLVYDNTAISFPTSTGGSLNSGASFTISSQTKPTINTGGGEDHTKILHLTGSAVVTANKMINGSVTAGVTVTHPLKSNLTNSGQSTASGILMYNLSDTSTNLVETFQRETKRIVSGSYDTQASLTTAGNVWNSTRHMSASNGGHSNGLQFYNGRLMSPTSTLNSGDFRNSADGGSLANGPSENPNYAGLSGQRTFYRWFRNTSGSTKYDFTIAITGTGTIVTAATALNSSRIRVFVKFPSNGSRSTGWLDLASEFVLDSYGDNAGAHTANGSLSFDSSLDATNYVTLGTVGVANNEYIGLRIEADEAWTGHVEDITVSFGAGTGTITPIPDLDDIDCNVDGTDANLSFGSARSITGYTNVGTAAGFSAVDLNGLYETDTSSNNHRRSIFALDTNIEGDLNEDVSADSNSSHVNHVANAFSDANSGSLKLEVNGAVVHTVSIAGAYNLVGAGAPGSGTGTSVNGNGSGFVNLSTWEAAEYNNGVPDYTEIYRTGRYRVHTADQRNGWNYARVLHSIAGSDRTTNYVEWVNDNNADALAQSGLEIKPFYDENVFHLSGVKYFVQPSGSIQARVANLYKNVYSDSNSAISFANLANATGVSIVQNGLGITGTKTDAASTATLQTLAATANSETLDLHATGSIRFSGSKSLMGTYTTAYAASGSLVFDHPLKSNLTTTVLSSSILHVFSGSVTANANTNENFDDELYRIQSGDYDTQGAVTSTANNWSPTGSLNDNVSFPGYYNGLMLYDGYLISPLDGGAVGDFRNRADGGVLDGPSGNVNYSTLGVATREYYRGFLNNTTDDRPSVTVTIRGDATIVGKTGPNAAALGTNKNIFVEAKVPGKTGFLDLGKPSDGPGNSSDGDGGLSGDLDPTIDSGGAVNTLTFNGLTVDGTTSGAQYFVLKISAHKDWTGYLSRVTVTWS